MFQNTTRTKKYYGKIIPLNIANIDTDNIIPKQFLQTTTRINFSKYLFFNWRYLNDSNNTINPKFVLNHACYKHANILLTQKNFGCGSSREHAVWALVDYGIQVIIAPSFSDIFYNNSFYNNLLLIILLKHQVNSLFNEIKSYNKNTFATINLHKKIIYTNNKTQYSFEINDFYYNLIMHESDNITFTLKYDTFIQQYENNQPEFFK